MNNIQQYTLPTYEQDTQQASTKSCTYKTTITYRATIHTWTILI